ncbi:hypothetical protein PENSPDRAFT_645480 [Peniophora sp. CONT]|nr:hypothetical protein PENSPDRAFT_645480 [Peniophora sp. CONT]
MFFTAALREATSGSGIQWKVIAWHKRVPTAVTRILPPYFSTPATSSDAQTMDKQGQDALTPSPRAYFVRTREQALHNVITHKDAKGTKWQMDTTPLGTCTLPPKPGEATDGLPGFQMMDATQLPRDTAVREGMKDGRLSIRLVRAGVSLPIGFSLVEQSYEGKRTSAYHFRPTTPVTPEKYNATLRQWMQQRSEAISYEQLQKEFPLQPLTLSRTARDKRTHHKSGRMNSRAHSTGSKASGE